MSDKIVEPEASETKNYRKYSVGERGDDYIVNVLVHKDVENPPTRVIVPVE